MSTRLAALTGGAPKPLTPVAGTPVLHRNLRWLAQYGITATFINLHHRAEEVKKSIGDGSTFGVKVKWSEETSILGTAGAAKKLERELAAKGPFLLVYGDNVFGFDLGKLIRGHQSQSPAPLATIAVFDPKKNPNTGIAGGRVESDKTGRVTGFVEGRPDASGHVNAGVYVCEAEILAHVPPLPAASDWAREIFPKLIAAGKFLRSHVIDGYCLGIDTPEAYRTAERMFAQGEVT
jgi:mannose-1-phosphate guanylyltransferase/phosphomannomutase